MAFSTISISYIYKDPAFWDRFELACNNAGWPKAIALTQVTHTFGKINLEYYQRAAEIDAKARGFAGHKGEHFSLLRDGDEMPPYVGDRPDYGQHPLGVLPDPDLKLSRSSLSRFKCSARNSALLRLAILIDRSNIQIAMTKLMRWYYSVYWEAMYVEQLAAEEQETLSPVLKGGGRNN